MHFVNCTPHPINIYRKDGTVLNLPKGEIVPRLTMKEECINVIDGVEIFETTYGNMKDLPVPERGTYFIVSRMVLDAKKDRLDFVAPGPAIRDDKGNIIGCKGLSF
jgi:hypothetical protein